jgi:hypothetical protein
VSRIDEFCTLPGLIASNCLSGPLLMSKLCETNSIAMSRILLKVNKPYQCPYSVSIGRKMAVRDRLPPELRRTLAERFTLHDFARDATAPGFRVALVTSMGGADATLWNSCPMSD